MLTTIAPTLHKFIFSTIAFPKCYSNNELMLTLGSKPFEFNWSNQRKNVAREN